MAIDPNALASTLPAGIRYFVDLDKQRIWRAQEIAKFQAERLAESGYLLAYIDDETVERVARAIFDEVSPATADDALRAARTALADLAALTEVQ